MITDAQLQCDVFDELQWEPRIDSTQIGVTVKDGVVALTGSVPVHAQKFLAEKVVKRVHGVKALANDLEVRLPGAGRRTDADLAAAAVASLKWDAEVPDNRLNITVRDGWITLDGSVDWQFQKEAADRAVRRLTGARGVTNSILVKPQEKHAFSAETIKSGIEAAFVRSAVVDSKAIQVEAYDGTVVLTGSVPSHVEREAAERAAWAAPGVRHVENQIEVIPRSDEISDISEIC